MITLASSLDQYTIHNSALAQVNKIAYNRAKGMAQSHDNQTYWDFGYDIVKTINRLDRDIKSGQFEFEPLLRIVRKVNARVRIIYIPTWRDKIVDHWLYHSLNKQLNNWFLPNCYAYRLQDRGAFGVDACQNSLRSYLAHDRYFIKRDISNYFYSINHDILENQLREIFDPNDPLYRLIKQRLQFKWIDRNETTGINEIGVPFGCAVACLLANIHLKPVDEALDKYKVHYHRYADDFLISGSDPEEAKAAADCLDEQIKIRGLSCKPSHSHNYGFDPAPGFEHIKSFKYLGLQYCADGHIRLALEKQRKIRRLFKRITSQISYKAGKDIDHRAELVVESANGAILNRVRLIAIIDYYLSHITDENQLVMLDRLIMEDIVAKVLNRKFKIGLLKHLSFKKIRQLGLISLVHRHRLIKHGHIKVSFLSLRDSKIISRYLDRMLARQEKINYQRLARKKSHAKSTIDS